MEVTPQRWKVLDMRAVQMIALLPALAACEAQPAPTPEPVLPNPILAAAETDRREHLAGPAERGDFKATFGEPFIAFESRGNRMAISQPYAEPNYQVIEAARTVLNSHTTIYTGESAAVNRQEPFILTIERSSCQHEFSGEQTRYVAYLGSAAEPRRWRSCASPAL